jgi:hypothetical protein
MSELPPRIRPELKIGSSVRGHEQEIQIIGKGVREITENDLQIYDFAPSPADGERGAEFHENHT